MLKPAVMLLMASSFPTSVAAGLRPTFSRLSFLGTPSGGQLSVALESMAGTRRAPDNRNRGDSFRRCWKWILYQRHLPVIRYRIMSKVP